MTTWVRSTDNFAWHRVTSDIDEAGLPVDGPTSFVEQGIQYRTIHSACDRTVVSEDPQGFAEVDDPSELAAETDEWPYGGISFEVCATCLAA